MNIYSASQFDGAPSVVSSRQNSPSSNDFFVCQRKPRQRLNHQRQTHTEQVCRGAVILPERQELNSYTCISTSKTENHPTPTLRNHFRGKKDHTKYEQINEIIRQ